MRLRKRESVECSSPRIIAWREAGDLYVDLVVTFAPLVGTDNVDRGKITWIE